MAGILIRGDTVTQRDTQGRRPRDDQGLQRGDGKRLPFEAPS